jgi:hypothetical protein
VSIVLTNTLFLSLALGVWVSVRSHDAHRAAKVTISLVLLLAAGPVVLDHLFSITGASTALFSLLSPGFASYMAYETSYSISPGRFWLSNLFLQVAAWALLLLAGRNLLKLWRGPSALAEPETPAWFGVWQARWKEWGKNKSGLRGDRLQQNPFFWLASRTDTPELLLWIIGLGAIALASGVLGNTPATWTLGSPFLAISGMLLKLLVASRASRCLVDSRQSGALELLLSTPLPAWEIVKGQRLALRRFLLWTALVGALLNFTLYQAAQLPPGAANDVLVAYLTFRAIAYAGVFAADVYALSWVAMWLALRVRGHNQVVARAFLYVIIVPWLGTSFWLFQGVSISGFNWFQWGQLPALLIVKDIFFVAWSKRGLKQNFGTMVAEGKIPRKHAPDPEW